MMRPSNQLLRLIGEAGESGITLDALDATVDLTRKAIIAAIGVLDRRGLLERLGIAHYRLTEAGFMALATGSEIKPGPQGERAPKLHARCLRARLWWAMRALGKFSLDDLLLRCAQGDEAAARNNAVKYVNALERSGHLVRMKHRQPGDALTSNGFVRWLLLRNTGPKAPVWQHQKDRVFDPNTGATIDLNAAQEASHA